QNESAESGGDLLKQIILVRSAFRERSTQRPAPPDSDPPRPEQFPELPHGWTWAPLGIIGANPFETVQTGPFGALLHKGEFTTSGVPVVAVGNLTGNGFRME